MKINEIMYADAIPSINWETVDLNKALEFESIDGQNILLFNSDNILFYLICNKDRKVIAYAAVENKKINGYNPLVRVENISKTKGLISIIIHAITMHNMKLVILKSEPLTNDGLKWIGKLIKNGGRGLVLTNQNGRKLNLEDLKELESEHKNAKVNLRNKNEINGNIEIYIENQSHISRINKINENTKIWKSNNLLKPAYLFLNSDDLW